jgi:hypothetical protein
MTTTTTPPAPTMNDDVEAYIKLRDSKSQLKANYDTLKAPVEAQMAALEGKILKHFQTNGIESARTEKGTAYKSVRTSATVADWDALLTFIKDNDLWHLLERRVSKDGAVQYKDENGALPPGINWREELTINVRRS